MHIDWRTAWENICDTARHPVYFVLFTTGVGLATVLAFTICIWAFVLTLVGSIVLPAVPFYFYRNFLAKRGWVFEILNLEETWEIEDATGAKVTLRKAMDVRFLRDEVTAINDPAWGDGALFSEYSCTPGSLATVTQGDARRYAVVTLNLPRRRGDIERFEIVRVIAGGFTARDEWIEVDFGNLLRPLESVRCFSARAFSSDV